jgi:hypothetical protein
MEHEHRCEPCAKQLEPVHTGHTIGAPNHSKKWHQHVFSPHNATFTDDLKIPIFRGVAPVIAAIAMGQLLATFTNYPLV